MPDPEAFWYGVRCVFHWKVWERAPYEERLTIWRAESMDEAIRLAYEEAQEYASENEVICLDFGQAYLIGSGEDPGHGGEVFSLLRDSELEPDDYLRSFFETGTEHT